MDKITNYSAQHQLPYERHGPEMARERTPLAGDAHRGSASMSWGLTLSTIRSKSPVTR